MKAENEPVDDSEFLLRLVPKPYFNAALPMPVAAAAFRPSSADQDGVSVFREACLNHAREALQAIPNPSKRSTYHIVRVGVADLKRCGLGLLPVPIPEVKGHLVIPELSLAGYNQNYQALQPVLVELAKLASSDIVLRPGE